MKWKQIKCPSTDEWEMWHIYTIGYYSGIQRIKTVICRSMVGTTDN
jgi:hypothetical protein